MRNRRFMKMIQSIALLLVCLTIFSVSGNMVFAAETAANANSYTVKSGDTLFKIAQKYGVSVDSLKQNNGLTSDMIYPGQVLSLVLSTGKYVIQAGDTLYLIGLRYGISVSSLKQANNLTSDMIIPGQVLILPLNANTQKSLAAILQQKNIPASSVNLKIVVDKSEHTLTLYSNGIWLKSYHVELGDGGTGDKQVAGDHKTPEGTFYVCEKSVLSPVDAYLGSRWMRLSYPNIEDADRGLNQRLIDQQTRNQIANAITNTQIPLQRTALGGGVGIHGGSTPSLGSDWTWGCVGLTNADVEDFYDYVKVGTPVIIQR